MIRPGEVIFHPTPPHSAHSDDSYPVTSVHFRGDSGYHPTVHVALLYSFELRDASYKYMLLVVVSVPNLLLDLSCTQLLDGTSDRTILLRSTLTSGGHFLLSQLTDTRRMSVPSLPRPSGRQLVAARQPTVLAQMEVVEVLSSSGLITSISTAELPLDIRCTDVML